MKDWTDIKVQVKRGGMEFFKIGELPGTLLKAESEDGQSIADRELKRMVRADVFRSEKDAIKKGNSNPRRNK